MSGSKLNALDFVKLGYRIVNSAASQRLLTLSQRYASGSSEPTGEHFLVAFRYYLRANRQSLLDLTVTAATADLTLLDAPSSLDPLLLKAIQDTNPGLSVTRLFALSDEARMGAINTAKGKYFEYLVVQRLNNGEQVGPVVLPSGFHAELAESMTQPAWDVRIVDPNGMTAEYLQFKATSSVGYVHTALTRYPDVQILTTHEVAARLHDDSMVFDSGMSNEHLQAGAAHGVDIVDPSIGESFLDYFNPLIPLVTMAAMEGYKVSIGQHSLEKFSRSLRHRGQRVLAGKLAGALVYALDGGLLTIPAVFAGGLWFDRMVNRTAIADAFAEHRTKLLAMRLYQQKRLLEGAV